MTETLVAGALDHAYATAIAQIGEVLRERY
jgi:hypothetical protein